MRRLLQVLFLAAVALAGCSGGASPLGFDQTKTPNCGPPPPVPAPFLVFEYPGDGATNVPTTIGELVFQGSGGASGVTVSANGAAVPTGPLQPAPSPLPSPLVTPPPSRGIGSAPYFAVAIGTLAPSTTYAVAFFYAAWDGNVPSCSKTVTVNLGSFTTQ